MSNVPVRLILSLLAAAAVGPSGGRAYLAYQAGAFVEQAAIADVVVVGKIVSVTPKSGKGVVYFHDTQSKDFTILEIEPSEIIAGPKPGKRVTLAVSPTNTKHEVGQEGLI